MSEKIAKTLVDTCLRVGPKDAVVVQTTPHMIDFANKTALACYKKGADVLTILDTDEVYFGYMKMLSTKQLKEPSPHCLGLGGYTTVNIFMGGPEDPSRFKEIPGEKFAATGKAEEPHAELMRKRKIRAAYIAMGAITEKRAKTYGLNLQRWKNAVEKASTEDYAKVGKLGRKIGQLLEKAKKVEITAPGGTRLKLQLAGRPVHVYDGIVDEEDLKKGAYFTSIPSGEVAVSVSETSAEGQFASNIPIPQVGRMIEGLTWKFKAGKIVGFTARKHLDGVKPQYDAAGGHKDRIAGLFLGLNTKGEPGQLFDMNPIASGAITISIGGNEDLGGKNVSEFGFAATVGKGTLKLDGKTIIKNGKYTI